MLGYTKLFSSILGSTIWREDLATKVVWVTLLALANADGVVEAAVPGLAHFAGVTIDEAEVALRKFLSPDPYSRSPEHEGRRIEVVDGGWRLLNHAKYREKMSPETVREQNRIRQQRHRKQENTRHAETVTERDIRDKSRESRHTDTDTKTETDTLSKSQNPQAPLYLSHERGIASPGSASAANADTHLAPPEEPAYDPAFDGEQAFTSTVDLFPEKDGGRLLRDYSHRSQVRHQEAIAEIQQELSCSAPEAAEWLKGKIREYLAGAKPGYHKSFLGFLDSKPWRNMPPETNGVAPPGFAWFRDGDDRVLLPV